MSSCVLLPSHICQSVCLSVTSFYCLLVFFFFLMSVSLSHHFTVFLCSSSFSCLSMPHFFSVFFFLPMSVCYSVCLSDPSVCLLYRTFLDFTFILRFLNSIFVFYSLPTLCSNSFFLLSNSLVLFASSFHIISIYFLFSFLS